MYVKMTNIANYLSFVALPMKKTDAVASFRSSIGSY